MHFKIHKLISSSNEVNFVNLVCKKNIDVFIQIGSFVEA